MGKGSGGESSSSGGSSAVSFAPAQLGSETSAQAFRPKWFTSAINGMFDYMKTQVIQQTQAFGGPDQITAVKDAGGRLKEYEDRAAQIADQMMVSFAQNIQPDEVKTFALDSFIESNVKEIYSKAKGIFDKPTLDRNEIKTLVDANTANIAGQFRSQRRNMEQQLASRGIDPNSAAGMAERDKMELEVSRAKEGTARQTLANEFGAKYDRQLSALGQMSGATQLGEAQVSRQSAQWLDQWGKKLQGESLRQSGLQLQLGANAQASGIAQQDYSNLWGQMNQPWTALGQGTNFLSNINQQAIEEFGRNVSAYGGAGSSSSWSQSEGTTPGSYSSPLGLWGGWST